MVKFSTRQIHGHLNYGSYHVIEDGWAIGKVVPHFTYGWEFLANDGHGYGRTRLDAVKDYRANLAARELAEACEIADHAARELADEIADESAQDETEREADETAREYRAGDLVEVTTGSAKTGNLRTLHGVVTGWTLRPIEGNDTHAFRVYTVETIEGTVTEAASRITLVRSAADMERAADEVAQDEMIRQGAEIDAMAERYGSANPVEIDDMPGGPMVYGRGRPFERARGMTQDLYLRPHFLSGPR